MQFGPIRRQPACRIRSTSARFARAPLGAAFAEPGADDADRADALGDAVVDRRQHVRRRHDDHGEIDRAGNVDDARVGGEPRRSPARSGGRARSLPVKPAADEVVEDLRADLAALAVGADDGDHARLEERPSSTRSRPSATVRRPCSANRSVTASDRATWQTPARSASSRRSRSRETRRASGGCRPARRRRTCLMPVLAREARQTLEQPRADAVPLHRVGHRERHFGAIGRLRIPMEAGEGDDPAARFHDQRRCRASVGARPASGPATALSAGTPMKAVVEAFRRERLEKLAAAPRRRVPPAGRRQTVDPSRTTTSVVATARSSWQRLVRR